MRPDAVFRECQEHPTKCTYQKAALPKLLDFFSMSRRNSPIMQLNLQVQHGRLPAPAFISDAEKVVAIAYGLAEKAADQPELQDDLLQLLAFGAAGELGPMAAMFGGIIGQEVRMPCSLRLDVFAPCFCKPRPSIAMPHAIAPPNSCSKRFKHCHHSAGDESSQWQVPPTLPVVLF